MESHENRNPATDSNELDMKMMLNFIAGGFRKIGKFIQNIVLNIQEILLLFFLFLRKWILWILLATAIGYGVGAYKSYSAGTKYYSEMTARFNFGSALTLYNTIDYLNGLTEQDDLNTLARIFSISTEEAGFIQNFTAEPVSDELAISDLYKQQYLDYTRSSLVRTDTFWTRTIPYSEFKKSLTKYNMPLQKITVICSRSYMFAKMQQGFINLINENPVLAKSKAAKDSLKKEEESIVLSSLRGLDTLRQVYNQRLRAVSDEKQTVGGNVNVLDKLLSAPNPELELYTKELLLKDELKKIQTESIGSQDIVQVYAPFYKYGKKSAIFAQHPVSYAIRALVAIFILLLIYELYKAIGQYEKKRKNNAAV